MIFFKLTDQYRISDTYINRKNCLGGVLQWDKVTAKCIQESKRCWWLA